MDLPRESGIIVHPTSFPGSYGIGEIGPEAYKFIDTLAEMGQHLWQILPMGPTSYGDSPYQSLSTFAGNHLLISFDLLMKAGLLSEAQLKKFPKLPANHVNYGRAIPARMKVLNSVCRTFESRASDHRKRAFRAFCKKEADWLDDYALFIALKNAHKGQPWVNWPEELACRDEKALERARRKYGISIRNVKILQYLFHDQWFRLRKRAHKKGVRIIGDIPIFVAHDSADVWANPDLFFLDSKGQPIVVAGVPPDYFSATGQLWGNPLYRWYVHQSSDYAWWIARIRKKLAVVDILRIDHFRGFEAYWEVPGYEETAMNGRWIEGPRDNLFEEMVKQINLLPIIAEDLGIITDEVRALRDRWGFPGMRILQFAFKPGGGTQEYLPENYVKHCVVYTGTHDNDTTVGWFHREVDKGNSGTREEIEAEHKIVLKYTGTDGSEIHWDMIGLALRSIANTAIIPLQDVMGLDSSGRMNVPGRPGGNWQWRFKWDMLTDEMKMRLRALSEESGRVHQA
ncbi:MAG: 4-alpha-glucanotransferase [Verrucomicrobia bacterium]|nr:4-alpha-glucanotransferase [Verrucomicrobiota bacterium]